MFDEDETVVTTIDYDALSTRLKLLAHPERLRILDAVRRDKEEDGIVSNPVLGVKARGRLQPEWRAQVETGAITQW